MQPNKDCLISWASETLGVSFLRIEDLVSTPHSCVLAFDVAGGVRYYLKQTPAQLYYEAAHLDILRRDFDSIPQIVARNDTLCAFITISCGDQTLRQCFGNNNNANNHNGFDLDLMCKGIAHYQNIQKTTLGRKQEFLQLGASDWRLENLPALYLRLLDGGVCQTLTGLHDEADEMLELKAFIPRIAEACNILSKFNLPQTLNHSDFHCGNIVIDHKSDALSIIDWGEINVAPSIVSLMCCLYGLASRYNLAQSSDGYQTLLSQICAPHAPEDLPLKDIAILSNLYYALGLQYLAHACDHHANVWGSRMSLALCNVLAC